MKGRIATAVLVAAILAGCGSVVGVPVVGDPIVDGWPIGPRLSCGTESRCPQLLDAARVGLDRRDPGHPEIVNVALHPEGATVDASGNRVLMKRSGACCSVARFELADGSVEAIGVGYPGISQTPLAIDYGP